MNMFYFVKSVQLHMWIWSKRCLFWRIYLPYMEDLENPVVADVRTNGIWTLEDGTKWARFNLPETSNNLRYAIACLDQEGNNFYQGIPYLINVGKEKGRIEEAVEKLKKENYKEITPFTYIEPCTFQYDWKYVKENAIIVNQT